MSSEKKTENLIIVPRGSVQRSSILAKSKHYKKKSREAGRENLWRLAVFDARLTPQLDAVEEKKVEVEKSKETRTMLRQIIETVMFFKRMTNEQKDDIVSKMWFQEVQYGECLIRSGESADNFYIIVEGEFKVIPIDRKLTKGQQIGELALMHRGKQATTVKAVSKSQVWAISRQQVKQCLIDTSARRYQEFLGLLSDVRIFDNMSERDKSLLTQALEIEKFDEGTKIINQGEIGHKFYLLKKGSVKAIVNEDGRDLNVKEYKVGDFFGERALTTNEKRAATCLAITPVEVLTLKKSAFILIVGAMNEKFQRMESVYRKSITAARKSVKPKKNLPKLCVIVDGEETGEKKDSTPIDEDEDLMTKNPNQLTYPDFKFDDLTIIGTLGRGAFGHVQLVTDEITVPGRKIVHACKTVNKALIYELQQVEHLRSEKEVMDTLNHPFLTRLRHTILGPHSLHLILEPVYGGELKSILEEEEYLEEDASRFIAASCLVAIDYMHSQGVTFRDLKPENILLTSTGYIKMADYGFAKKIGNGRTYTLCGTPDYLAPEVVAAQGHDMNVDFWTIGILIYEMLVGEPPFWDENPMGIYQNIMRGEIDYPEELSQDDIDIIKAFLTKVTERLGATVGGFQAVKDHKWFAGFKWDDLIKQTMKPPDVLVKPVSDELDISNFEDTLGEDDRWRDWNPKDELEDGMEDPFLNF